MRKGNVQLLALAFIGLSYVGLLAMAYQVGQTRPCVKPVQQTTSLTGNVRTEERQTEVVKPEEQPKKPDDKPRKTADLTEKEGTERALAIVKDYITRNANDTEGLEFLR